MFLKEYGTTMGPIGVPMTDEQARQLDDILKNLDEVEYHRMPVEKGLMDLIPEERADISWITTESLDRHRDIVLAAGMDDSHFRANPIVTLGHQYSSPPVGRSAWRMRVTENDKKGIKAKTIYPPRPDDWAEKVWAPDVAFALVQSKLAAGKSIGFLPIEASSPTPDELRKNPSWAEARRIVRKWMLLEYAIHWLPVNQEAVVETVTKGGFNLSTDDLIEMGLIRKDITEKQVLPISSFTTEEEIKRSVKKQISKIDLPNILATATTQTIHRMRGKV